MNNKKIQRGMSTLRTSVSQQNWLTEIILDIRLRKIIKRLMARLAVRLQGKTVP